MPAAVYVLRPQLPRPPSLGKLALPSPLLQLDEQRAELEALRAAFLVEFQKAQAEVQSAQEALQGEQGAAAAAAVHHALMYCTLCTAAGADNTAESRGCGVGT
jgi:hypothetical protein